VPGQQIRIVMPSAQGHNATYEGRQASVPKPAVAGDATLAVVMPRE
jgi:hypothetical protein